MIRPGDRCSACGRPAERTLGAKLMCHACTEAVLDPIRQRVIARHGDIDRWPPPGSAGYGRQAGPLRPDYGPGWADLRCDECGAGWVGRPGEPCDWCVRSLELLTDAHRRVLLHPELPGVDDQRRPAAVRAWAVRLANAVKAGILQEHEARAAIRREEGRRVA